MGSRSPSLRSARNPKFSTRLDRKGKNNSGLTNLDVGASNYRQDLLASLGRGFERELKEPSKTRMTPREGHHV